MSRNEEGDLCPYEDCSGSLEWGEREGDCSCHINPPCHYCVDRPMICAVCGEDPEDCAEPVEKIDARLAPQPAVRAPQPPPTPQSSSPPPQPLTEREIRANAIWSRLTYSDEYGSAVVGDRQYRSKIAMATDPVTGTTIRSTGWIVWDGSAEAELSDYIRSYVNRTINAEDRKAVESRAYIQWPTYTMRPTC